MDEDFLLDEEEDEVLEFPPSEENEESAVESEEELSETDEPKIDESKYEGKLTKEEIWLISAYDDIIKSGNIEDAATVIVMANPKHTSANTVSNIVKDLFHKQGHSRMVNGIYVPDTPLRGEDLDEEIEGDSDDGFNRVYAQEMRDQIARFIDYLASRNLSKDSVVSARRKQRQIPAFIIFLFSSGMYDLIVDCPTMPKEYDTQIKEALKKIMKTKYDIVEALAKKYEEMGRPKVAERVRLLQLSWFYKEPAEIRYSAEYRDLELTQEDVAVYRQYRSRFTNTSSAITQDIISDMIEVVLDGKAGVYEKLKDKTRSDAISDVKQVYKEWSATNTQDSELAKKVIYKEL